MPRKKADTSDRDAVTPDSGTAEPHEDQSPPDSTQETEVPDESGAEAVSRPEAEPEPEPPIEAPEVGSTATDEEISSPEPARSSFATAERVEANASMAGGAHEVPEDGEDHHEYETGPSFASRLLWILAILAAGAGLGIWAAPKFAPVLPAGMAPVAEWLAPGSDAVDERLVALEGEVGSRIADLESRLAALSDTADVQQEITAAIDAAEARSNEAIAELRTHVADMDGAETRQRLGRLESAIEGQSAEFATLKEQFTGGIAATSAQSEQAVAQIDVYQAELDGLRAEFGSLSDTVNGFAARIDEVAAAADRSIQAAEEEVAQVQAESSTALDAAAVAADVALVRAALAAGQPFPDAVERLSGHPDLAVPEAITAAAATGAPTLVALQDRYPDAAHAAIRASIRTDAGDGVLARSRAFLESQVASRSLTPQEGGSTDAVLSRMENHLRQGDLRDVLSEADQLPPEAASAMQAWLADARLRADAQDGLAALDSSLSATN